jgi:phosphate acetyltransferase
MDSTTPERHRKYRLLIERAKSLAAVPTAVAHPCDDVSLEAAVEAAKLGLIAPVLVGPAAKIRAVAAEHRISSGPWLDQFPMRA